MYREKKLPPLKLYPSWKQQWSMQGIVIKFLVILVIQQENCKQISTILQIIQSFPNCTFQNFNCLKLCIPMCFIPPPLHQWMNDAWGFLSISSLFFLPPFSLLFSEIPQFWKRYRVVQGKLKVSDLETLAVFPKHCSQQPHPSPAAKTHTR